MAIEIVEIYPLHKADLSIVFLYVYQRVTIQIMGLTWINHEKMVDYPLVI
jgi:hypothetical protein